MRYQLRPFLRSDLERLCRDLPSLAKFFVRQAARGWLADIKSFAVGEDSYLLRFPDPAPSSPYANCYFFWFGGLSYQASLIFLGDVVVVHDAPELAPHARLEVEAAMKAAFDVHGYWGAGGIDGICGDLRVEWRARNGQPSLLPT